MSSLLTTFPVLAEFEKARAALDDLGLPYEAVCPDPACARVGVPALVVDSQIRMDLLARHGADLICSGWVDFRPARAKAPLEIFKRLPRTNCRACGEPTCLAFAVKVWQAAARPSECQPVFSGEYGRLREALLEIRKGLGATV
jgi:hypothetical protein